MGKLNFSIVWECIKIISFIIAPLAFLYGWLKDRELKRIHRRANSPFFEFETFALDASSQNAPDHYEPWLNYKQIPSKLDGNLVAIDEAYPRIPGGYPDNLVIGIELINRGVEIRSFSVKNKNICFMHKRNNIYSLRYFFKRKEIGEKLFFTIAFETIDGVQEKQKWLHIKGTEEIKRVKPKSINL